MWTNWSGGQHGQPVATVRPLDEAGVRAAVRRAAERGERLRPVGAGHSYSPLAVTDETALELSALTGVVSCDTNRVRARAGTTLAQLHAALSERDLSLAAFGDVDTPTVAGAVATGMHGSSATVGSLSAQVTGIRLVDGTGQAIELPAEELPAARTGLGVLGVVTEVELAVRPRYLLRLSHERLPLAEALSTAFLDAHACADLSVFPYTGEALTRYADEVDEPAPRSRGRTVRSLERRLVRSAAVGGGVALGRTVPRWCRPSTGRPPGGRHRPPSPRSPTWPTGYCWPRRWCAGRRASGRYPEPHWPTGWVSCWPPSPAPSWT